MAANKCHSERLQSDILIGTHKVMLVHTYVVFCFGLLELS
jgi:hypothetical protein